MTMTLDELKVWANEEVNRRKKEHEECCADNTISFRTTVEAEGRLTQAYITLGMVSDMESKAERRIAEVKRWAKKKLVEVKSYGVLPSHENEDPNYADCLTDTLNKLNEKGE